MARDPSLAALDDESLAIRCRGTDEEAFAELVDRHKHGVCRFVARLVGTRDSEDIAQEAFLRAYQALPRFRGEATFRTWLYRIARNLCFTELRRRGRQGEWSSLEEEAEETYALREESTPELAEEIARADLSARVREKMAALPAPYRGVLTLFYLDELRYEEIAMILDVPVGTVKTWIHRARLRLRDVLIEEAECAMGRKR
ncbi:MAG TPA: sigma-70 family RNA polymerase sigma factor [Candidatus Udaeobacter sp.]|nr:sigma-70 family RNA polymerase sigma factor [Candidatus Udaeobacter sp.]